MKEPGNLARPSHEARVVELLKRIAVGVEMLVSTKAPAHGDALLGAPEVAKLLGIDVRTLRELRRAKAAPPHLMVGRTAKWQRRAVDAWIERRARP